MNRLAMGAAPTDEARLGFFAQQLSTPRGLGCNLVVLDSKPSEIAALDATALNKRRIDVWFRVDSSSRLALLLAYLSTRTPDWKEARIRLLTARPGT